MWSLSDGNMKSMVSELAMLAIAWAIGMGVYKGFVGSSRPLTPLEWAGGIALFVGTWVVLTLYSKSDSPRTGTRLKKILPWLVIPAVACVVALVLLPCGIGSHPPSRRLTTISLLRAWRVALDDYRNDCGRYPSQEEGLNALLVSPGVSNWHGPYLEGMGVECNPKDGWGTPLRYSLTAAGPDVVSAGSDRRFGTADDLNVAAAQARPSNQAPPAVAPVGQHGGTATNVRQRYFLSLNEKLVDVGRYNPFTRIGSLGYERTNAVIVDVQNIGDTIPIAVGEDIRLDGVLYRVNEIANDHVSVVDHSGRKTDLQDLSSAFVAQVGPNGVVTLVNKETASIRVQLTRR